ncbi:YaiO family outer membrane beta-barrel protein [Lysobacter humi (ex Lee et al. 2017)]
MSRRLVLTLALLAALPAAAQAPDAIAQARRLVEARDFAGAAAVLEQRLAAQPADGDARLLLARVTAWGGDPERALPMYVAMLATRPDDPDVLFGYGQALLWSGRPAEAVAALERALALAPGYADVVTLLAQARATTAPVPPPDAGRATGGAAGPGPGAVIPDPAAPLTGTATVADGSASPTEPPATADRRRRLVLSARHDRLDGAYDDWDALRLDVVALPRDRVGAYGAVFAERRFGLVDRGLEAGLVLPLGDGWTLQPELGVVPGADVLPRQYGDLRLQKVWTGGWVGAASLRHSRYRDVDVQRLALGIERYAGDWRFGYTLNTTRLAGRYATGHDLRAVRAYGDGGEVGVQVASGREAALLGTQVVASEVTAATLFGRHPLATDWRLLWNIGGVDQGDLYTRRGIGLGLERRF